MTETMNGLPTEQVIDVLTEELHNLAPAEREAKAVQLLSVLGRSKAAAASAARPPAEPGDTRRAPLLICDWATDLGLDGTTQQLGIDVAPGPTRVSKTADATGHSLLSSGHVGADILHVPAGSGFAPHTHPGDHLLFVLAGTGTIAVAGEIVETRPGQVYMVEGAITHAVGAVTDHMILSVGAPHRHLDSPERQELTAYTALLGDLGHITCRLCDIQASSGEELAAKGCPHSPHRFG
ncbi:cupin domain-containing protein [Streptomyces sp. TG1A-8]|uniref:cupin domain-containing protein n=1 Tax=Streptomyces sp. TG1A-8 TaxID=3051385 RepID=UPI00265C6EB5|nr:cupin domain-containing protein [Streptomyces sp. TG1A-8]MDO0924956.1 cupin domain-containing protein [Streptomyces sp. TG1A-8]MDO0928872.1 cupin domain-containing protein [Streptomyces sp. TG1A-8]